MGVCLLRTVEYEKLSKGAREMFNIYVDKNSWVGGSKCLFFVRIQNKNVQVEVGRWFKKGQNCVHVVRVQNLDTFGITICRAKRQKVFFNKKTQNRQGR